MPCLSPPSDSPRPSRRLPIPSRSGSAATRWSAEPTRSRCRVPGPHIRADRRNPSSASWCATYDGKGNVTQVDNIKGSISGYFPDRFGAGTYHVNDDCSVVIDFEPVPGLLVQERAVIIDNGRELRSIVSFPESFMITAVHQRV